MDMTFTQANIIKTAEDKVIRTFFVDITDKNKKEHLLSLVKKNMEAQGFKKKAISEALNWGAFRIDLGKDDPVPVLYFLSEDGRRIEVGYKFSREEQKKVRKLNT